MKTKAQLQAEIDTTNKDARDIAQWAADLSAESDVLRSLLKEAVKIVHAHSRNINKDWLIRARATLRRFTSAKENHRT